MIIYAKLVLVGVVNILHNHPMELVCDLDDHVIGNCSTTIPYTHMYSGRLLALQTSELFKKPKKYKNCLDIIQKE